MNEVASLTSRLAGFFVGNKCKVAPPFEGPCKFLPAMREGICKGFFSAI